MLAFEAGAAAVGFVAVGDVDADAQKQYDSWLEAGMQAGMGYMERNREVRNSPGLMLEGAQTMIITAFNYHTAERPCLGISRYALGSDYHNALRRQLRPMMHRLNEQGAESRLLIDSAPLRERYWAEKAGLGFIGRNSQLIIPGIGSYCFLATILTTAPLPAGYKPPVVEDGCGDCRRCRDACPGKAITSTRSIDARRCISYLTIEAPRAEGSDFQWPADVKQGSRLFGCDTCQDVCPYNSEASTKVIDRLMARPEVLGLTADELAAMTPEQFDGRFAGSPLRRAGLTHLQALLILKNRIASSRR